MTVCWYKKKSKSKREKKGPTEILLPRLIPLLRGLRTAGYVRTERNDTEFEFWFVSTTLSTQDASVAAQTLIFFSRRVVSKTKELTREEDICS